jgi:hypothetical protein
LSAIIKIARFIVVQKALEIAGPDDKDKFDDNRLYNFEDSRYESDSSASPVLPARRREGYLQLVARMIDKFMVRGSHSLMQ